MKDALDLDAVRSARRRIAPWVLRTPVLRLSPRPGLELFAKAESLQATGAFKLRGAFSLMTTLPRGCPGVVAHSSGNHAQAVARAARALGLRAVVVMPDDAPANKRARTAADGAEIVTVGSDSDLRARRDLGGAGQGTSALELLEEVDSLDAFYAPVSGGGLMAGCAVALHALQPSLALVAVEPEDANDTALSLAAGERRKIPPPRTIADGLRVRTPGELTWPVLRQHLARVALVSDEELLDAMAFALCELRLVLEPSGAAALAAALREGSGRVGVLLSGGNADPAHLAEAARRAAASAYNPGR